MRLGIMTTKTMQHDRAYDIQDPTDLELFRKLAEDEATAQAALTTLYRRYSQRIYTYCRKITADNTVAQDLLQETFVKLYNSGKKARPVENLPAYLLTIARNLCLTHRTQSKRQYVEVEDFHLSVRDVPYEQKELLGLIQAALELLPEEFREVFVLREYNGLAYEEIATVIGQSVDLVKVRIFRAKKKLREILAPYLHDIQNKA